MHHTFSELHVFAKAVPTAGTVLSNFPHLAKSYTTTIRALAQAQYIVGHKHVTDWIT